VRNLKRMRWKIPRGVDPARRRRVDPAQSRRVDPARRRRVDPARRRRVDPARRRRVDPARRRRAPRNHIVCVIPNGAQRSEESSGAHAPQTPRGVYPARRRRVDPAQSRRVDPAQSRRVDPAQSRRAPRNHIVRVIPNGAQRSEESSGAHAPQTPRGVYPAPRQAREPRSRRARSDMLSVAPGATGPPPIWYSG